MTVPRRAADPEVRQPSEQETGLRSPAVAAAGEAETAVTAAAR